LEEPAIIAKNLTKTFKINKAKGLKKLFIDKQNENSFKALDGISFTVPKGEALGIIGLNGSGKTTLLRIISGLIKPDSGTITTNGNISPLLQLGAGFHPELDARNNVLMNGLLLGLSKSEIENKIDSIIEWAELERFSRMKLLHFSTGMRTRLGFSIAMQIDSDILIIDEVLSVGDRIFREKSYDAFLSFRKNKKTIIHVTHNLQSLSEFADRILLLHRGKMLMLGKPDEVIKKYNKLPKPNKN